MYFTNSSRTYYSVEFKTSNDSSSEEMSEENAASADDKVQHPVESRPVPEVEVERLSSPSQESEVSVDNDVNLKNIRVSRTTANYLDKRKIAPGRKMVDPGMEPKLLTWIQDYTRKNREFPEKSLIKQVARKSNHADYFKASKGWLDKFMKRNESFLGKIRFSYGAGPASKTNVVNKPQEIYPEHMLHMKLRRNRVVLAQLISTSQSGDLQEHAAAKANSNGKSTAHLGGSVKKLKLK